VNPSQATRHSRNPLIDEARRHPLLAREEELDLARRAGRGDADALHRLVASHLRYVLVIARRYRGWGAPMNDLIQQGTLGLVQAVRRFDPDRGVRLSTYAMWAIRAAMQEYVLHSWSVVRLGTGNAQKMLALQLRRIADEVVRGEGDPADDRIGMLARQFNATAAEVARLARRMAGRDGSLDQPQPSGGAAIDALACEQPTPEQAVARDREQRMLGEAVRGALERLTPRERLVIRKRYLEDAKQTFEAIGRELGVSKDRARQLEAKALAKLDDLLHPAASALGMIAGRRGAP
jgi:RNA polymerase sigma-32 factor